MPAILAPASELFQAVVAGRLYKPWTSQPVFPRMSLDFINFTFEEGDLFFQDRLFITYNNQHIRMLFAAQRPACALSSLTYLNHQTH